MNFYRLFAAAIAGALLLANPAVAAEPATWDGLVQVQSKRLHLVYLQPGADFRTYTKVMLDPTEVAFRKNWLRSQNSSSRTSRVSESELQKTIGKGIAAATDIFAKAWTGQGYALVNSPGPDVLRVRTGVLNIDVNAPESSSGRSTYSFAHEAGSATLFVEARDSLTGAILGRAVDQRIVGDNTIGSRTSSSNRADFRDVVEGWAAASVRGLAELKALSPVQP